MKNLKLNKKVAIVASSIALTQAVIYTGFVKIKNVKPFVKNEYEHHLVRLTEFENNVVSEYYSPDEIKMNEAVIVKTPYNIDSNKNITCEVIAIPTSKFTTKDLNYIKHNYNNQKLVLTDKDIQSKLIDLYNQDNVLLTYKQTNSIPENNNYEISYSTIDEDFTNISLLNDETKDMENTIDYLICSSLGLCVSIPVTLKLTKKLKK